MPNVAAPQVPNTEMDLEDKKVPSSWNQLFPFLLSKHAPTLQVHNYSKIFPNKNDIAKKNIHSKQTSVQGFPKD